MPNDAQRATIRALTQTHGPGSLGLQSRPVVGESKPSELITWHSNNGVFLIDAAGKVYKRGRLAMQGVRLGTPSDHLYEDEDRHLCRVRDGRLERVSMLGQPGADS